jgi:hypothetical protein
MTPYVGKPTVPKPQWLCTLCWKTSADQFISRQVLVKLPYLVISTSDESNFGGVGQLI